MLSNCKAHQPNLHGFARVVPPLALQAAVPSATRLHRHKGLLFPILFARRCGLHQWFRCRVKGTLATHCQKTKIYGFPLPLLFPPLLPFAFCFPLPFASLCPLLPFAPCYLLPFALCFPLPFASFCRSKNILRRLLACQSHVLKQKEFVFCQCVASRPGRLISTTKR